MQPLVMKFGGTSLADLDRIAHAAAHVAREVQAGQAVAVVVSAMAGTTDQLAAWTRQASPLHDAREYDAVVSAGEQITAGLLAIALQNKGVSARSWLGWQIPIHTDDLHGSAAIRKIETARLNARLKGQVAVVAGFQGLAPGGRIATLGRGGSDASAVALAIALQAKRCDIYTDVRGIYTADPRIVESARRLDKITYEEMLEMASLGARVLQSRAVGLAMAGRMPLCVRAAFEAPDHTPPGTLVCGENRIMQNQPVSGIAHSRDEAKITLTGLADTPGTAARILAPLAQAGINVDMIVQSAPVAARPGAALTFTVARADLDRARRLLDQKKSRLGHDKIESDPEVAKVSIIGIGMRSHAGAAQLMFQTLGEAGINIQAISTSEIKVSVLIGAQSCDAALRALHDAYGLGG